MTTVGYGDYIADSFAQKVTTVFVVITGSFVSSVLTLTVLNFFKLTDKENKAYLSMFFIYEVLNRLEVKKQIE